MSRKLFIDGFCMEQRTLEGRGKKKKKNHTHEHFMCVKLVNEPKRLLSVATFCLFVQWCFFFCCFVSLLSPSRSRPIVGVYEPILSRKLLQTKIHLYFAVLPENKMHWPIGNAHDIRQCHLTGSKKAKQTFNNSSTCTVWHCFWLPKIPVMFIAFELWHNKCSFLFTGANETQHFFV